MPHPADKYDADTLPDPELNPLLNPLLAAHMGRWAEVYFTNPPEKREQAVSQLLRELENASPAETASLQTIPDESAKEKMEIVESLDSPPITLPPVLTCSACAYDNSAGQRFCGMCGKPLQVSPEAHLGQFAEAAPVTGGSWCERSLGGNLVEEVQHTIDPTVRSAHPSVGRYDTVEPTWPLPEKNPLHFGAESEPRPYRYPFYVGAVLVILLAVLGYMAWRGTEAHSNASAPQSAPSRAISQSHPALVASTQPSTTESPLAASTPPTPPVQSRPDASLRPNQAADSQSAPRLLPVAAASSSVVAVAPSGAEELAMAEKYLNGTPGTARDSGEAAQWLWKAVRKQNLEATLALSDLYLRGDGVPKSCDQARLLLDAAARKGGKGAAERLRNLQAFGCD